MQTEAIPTGEFLLSEAHLSRSRGVGVLAASQTVLSGTILGKITLGALTGTGSAVAGNTGAATITASPAVAAGTPLGDYLLTAISAGATAEWLMTRPDGVPLGNVTTAVAATLGGVGPFTIADPGTDPAIGDQMKIVVAAAAGSNRYVPVDPEATDGSQVAVAIAFTPAVTASGETKDIVIIERDAEVKYASLDFGDLDTTEKAAAVTQLAALGIICRS